MSPLVFDLPSDLIADGPIESTGTRRRDEARLLVASRSDETLVDTTFAHLDQHLQPGDLLIVNRSGTVPAALPTGDGLVLHLSTELPDGRWVVELRRPCGAGSTPFLEARVGRHVPLPGGGWAVLQQPFGVGPTVGPADRAGVRLWVTRLVLPLPIHQYLNRHGRPIRYGCTETSWPISAYQTVFATEPGSAEMPSAGRAFTTDLLARLDKRGVGLAPITLHTGVSSQEAGELPYAERYRVAASTADMVNRTRCNGGRVIAVGTTAVRAIETVTDPEGVARPGRGWTELVITPERGVRAVDGIITGWHEPEASHLMLLEAVGGRPVLERSYAAALDLGYHWHEFGDFHLIVP